MQRRFLFVALILGFIFSWSKLYAQKVKMYSLDSLGSDLSFQWSTTSIGSIHKGSHEGLSTEGFGVDLLWTWHNKISSIETGVELQASQLITFDNNQRITENYGALRFPLILRQRFLLSKKEVSQAPVYFDTGIGLYAGYLALAGFSIGNVEEDFVKNKRWNMGSRVQLGMYFPATDVLGLGLYLTMNSDLSGFEVGNEELKMTEFIWAFRTSYRFK